jgi:hypothetical protein
METRYRRVEEVATAHLEAVTAALARHVAAPEGGFGAGARDAIAVWHPGAPGTAVVEAELELDLPLGRAGNPRPVHLRAPGGARIPASVELVRPPGAAASGRFERRTVVSLLPGLRREFNALYANGLESERRGDQLAVRVRLGATPEAGFDLEATRRSLLETLADETIREVAVEVFEPPRVRLRFADVLPGHGLRVYRLATGAARAAQPVRAEALAGGGAAIGNATWRVEADASGRVTLRVPGRGVVVEDALRIVSEGDRGDEYNFDPVPGAEVVERPERARVRARRLSDAEAELVLSLHYRVPEALVDDRSRRSARQVGLPARLVIRLHQGLDRIDLALEVENRALDHRLRLHCRAPFVADRLEVESAFEVAERPIDPAPDAFGDARPSELPVGAGPQRSFATLAGGDLALTVANRGLAEVEAVPGASSTELAVTLLRAVGWLSRGDLRLRPGPAGPILATPGAQVPGLHRGELSLRLHAKDDPRRAAEAHAFAHPPFAFPVETRERGPLADGVRLLEVDDPQVLVSAVEPLADGGASLRLVNLSERPRAVKLRWNGPASALRPVDLSGRPTSKPSVTHDGDGRTVAMRLGPWEIATLRTDRPA